MIKMDEKNTHIGGSPEDCKQMVNKYGTYNIQPTADADNLYPAIAQGLADKTKKQRRRDQKGYSK